MQPEMKRTSLALTTCLAAVFTSCIGTTGSAFFSSFSFEKLAKNDKSNVGLVCDSNGEGGGGGSHFSSFGFGRKQFDVHKGLDFACKLKPEAAERLKGTRLIDALQLYVEQALRDSGAKVIDRGNLDPATFYFAYSLEDLQGRVQISGRITSGNYLSLQGELNENGK
jgi:hypothetical protein